MPTEKPFAREICQSSQYATRCGVPLHDKHCHLRVKRFYSVHCHHVEQCHNSRLKEYFIAASDLGVGLLVQPMYIVARVLDLTESGAKSNPIYNTANKASLIIGVFFSYTSEFGVMALSADRFLAIRLHLRYKELVTHSRVVAVMTSIWMLSAVPSTLVMLNPDNPYPIFAVFDCVFIVTTSLLCCKIYATVRRHKNRIQAQHVQRIPQNGELMPNVERQTPTVRGAF